MSTDAETFRNKSVNDLAGNWAFLAGMATTEVKTFRGARQSSEWDLEMIKRQSTLVDSVFAAQYFPDDSPPFFEIANTEMEDHDSLKAKNPSDKKRISGDLIQIKNFPFKIFMMDYALYADSISPTDTKAQAIVDQLLNQNILPVTASFQMM